MSVLESLVGPANDFIWTYILIGLLLVIGLYFTIRTKFVQIHLFGEMFRLIVEKKGSDHGVSAFQRFRRSRLVRLRGSEPEM